MSRSCPPFRDSRACSRGGVTGLSGWSELKPGSAPLCLPLAARGSGDVSRSGVSTDNTRGLSASATMTACTCSWAGPWSGGEALPSVLRPERTVGWELEGRKGEDPGLLARWPYPHSSPTCCPLSASACQSLLCKSVSASPHVLWPLFLYW